MKSFIPASELDFNSYKESLKTFLRNQDRFKDYDFEGSNLSVLIDILAYNTYNNAHYLNMVGSEMFLDSAQLRESVVSHAKELNYTPRSRISARASVSVEITPTGSPESIIIPKHYVFKATTAGSNTIRFVTDQPIVVKKDAQNRFISDPFMIYEGIVVTEKFTVQPTITVGNSVRYSQRFVLQSENLDMTSIEVSVQNDVNDVSPIVYSKAESLYGLSDFSNVFFLRGYKANHYEIEFGDGVLGRALKAGNIITVKYRDTVGADGNGRYSFGKSSQIDGYSDINVTTHTRATGGAERESDESIKYHAVRHFQVQERAVIETDYEVLIKTTFPEIQEVSVYGGEIVDQYGKVMIVLKPHEVDGLVSDDVKSQVIQYLKTKNIVPEPVVVDPEYYYLGIDGSVYYDINATTKRETQLYTQVIEALLQLNETILGDFDTVVHQSTINRTITDSDPAITGSDITLTMVKRWAPLTGFNQFLSFSTDNPIQRSPVGRYPATNPTKFGIQSSMFKAIVSNEVVDCIIQDDGIGNIHLFTVNSSGVRSRVSKAIGKVNYDTGSISLTQNVYSYNPYIAFTCLLEKNSIDITKNKFISVDTPHINLSMVK